MKKLVHVLPFVFLMLLMLNCTERPADETARSGALTVAVDRQFESIASTERELFSRYYPEAHIKLMPAASRKTLMHLLNHEAGAALINGDLQAGEDSLVSTRKRQLRREPVGRDAIVCIVSSRNPRKSLSIKELSLLYTQSGTETTPLVTADDYRLMTLFAAKIGKKKEELHAWACSSDSELIRRVAQDNRAIGLLFRSSLDAATSSGRGRGDIKILPIANGISAESPYMPNRQNIFDGHYPLVTTVYYVYYPGNALAAGFGSWLGSTGQKGFEQSVLVPLKLIERTIILK
jgi:phosphate transport system substrate-binding protein